MNRLVLLLALLLLAGSAGLASAAWLGRTPPIKPAPGSAYQGGGRTGGDTIADATPIASLPFTDAGSTCGFANNYDEACPYAGSTAPDVVYSYFSASDENVHISLCASLYDTKVYVWEDIEGNLVGCNDDGGCGYSYWQSEIWGLDLHGGHTYYIVVDGYGGLCGDYALTVEENPPCVVTCPPGAPHEGEPPCVDQYDDNYNGGCENDTWTPLPPQDGGCGVMCGRSCTYQYNGLSYRDSDWYTLTAAGGTVNATCTAEFNLQFMLIYLADCNNLQYIIDTGLRCEPVELSRSLPAGQEFWLWVGPAVFSGLPESNYTLEACGISEPLPLGACCLVSSCSILTEQVCAQYDGAWLGPDTDCSPDPCGPNPPGACCLAGGCEVRSESDCVGAQGTWLGAGTDCDPDPCGSVPAQHTTWGAIKNIYR